jgi:hypothetical protein
MTPGALPVLTQAEAPPSSRWAWLDNNQPLPVAINGEIYVLEPRYDTWDLIDIAANYRWWDLLPGCLRVKDQRKIDRLLRKRGSRMSMRLLHYGAQQLGDTIYGWPFFTASRLSASLRSAQVPFLMWCTTHGVRPAELASAVEVCAVVAAWLYEATSTDQKKRKELDAQLSIPNALDPFVPGMTPSWRVGN